MGISEPGRVIAACRKHVDDITELTQEERAQYIEDINRIAVCIHRVFRPDKINFGAYGDTMHHLHVHIVPKYRDGYEWGGVFAMNPHRTEPSDEELQKLIDQIKENL